MSAFSSSVDHVSPTTRLAEHGGVGPICFRRLLDGSGFQAPVDFIDYTIIPPNSVIGRHQHVGNEEVYFVIAGKPSVTVENDTQRLCEGSVSVVRNGESHQLVNDTNQDVIILVVQVRCES
ncbi:MAG: cupin domain-containing protein [Janthinobacterium lividum]